MDKNPIDETLKIKKLKEQEAVEPISKPNSKKYIAIFVFGTGLIMLICVGAGLGLLFVQNNNLFKTQPINTNTPAVINTPSNIATMTPIPLAFENQYELTVTSLSTQLAPNSSSTISFQINHVPGVDNGLCSGRFEIINMAQLKQVYEQSYTEENDAKTNGLWITLAASDGKRTNHTIGDDVPLFDGDVGQTDFHLANAPQFRQVANRFSDGESDWVIFASNFMNNNGRSSGGTSLGTPEWEFFGTETDLERYEIRMIRRDIGKLIIQPEYYLFDVVWSFWALGDEENDWVRVSPTTGNLNPQENQTILVEFSSDSLEASSYKTELLFDFGEGCSAPVIIPIDLTVVDD